MIHDHTVEIVYPLAKKLADKGMRVHAIETTPVDALVRACHLDLPAKGYTSGDWDVFSEISRTVEGSRAPDASGVIRHDMILDEQVSVISQTIANNFKVARTVVNPMICDAVEIAQDWVDAQQNQQEYPFKITMETYHGLWDQLWIQEMVKRYRETAFEEVPLKHAMNQLPDDPQMLYEMIKTGVSRMDDALLEWYEAHPEALSGVADAVFGRQGAADMEAQLNNYIGGLRHDECGRNRVLATFLMARYLLNNPPEALTMGLDAYRNYMASIVSQSGRILGNIIQKRERAMENNQLVVRIYGKNEAHGEVVVNSDIYSRWLEAGGTPEVLLGSLLSDQETGYQTLIENKDKYEAIWDKKRRVYDIEKRLNLFNHTVEGLNRAVTQLINRLYEDNPEYCLFSLDVYHQRLKEELKMVRGTVRADIYHWARRLICKVIFPHTDALTLLTAIDRVKEDHPDMPIREAATWATIEVVGEWIGKLYKVEYTQKGSA